MRQPIFFHNQCGEDVISAMRALPAQPPKVELSVGLIEEIREALGLAGPTDATVVLLRPEFVKRRPSAARRSKLAASASAVVTLLTTLAFALAAGAMLPLH